VRLAILSSFYDFASSYTYTGNDGRPQLLFDHASPIAGLHAGKTTQVYRAFSYDELSRFFAAIPVDTVQGRRDRAIFLMYLWTARRLSEVAELRWGDIERAIFMERGTRHEGWLYHFRNKGEKGKDDIAELPGPAKEAIDRYLEASGRVMTADSPLFVAVGKRNKRSKPLAPRVIWYLFKGYVRKAGLDDVRLTVHSLRHTAAQTRFRAGESLESLQRLLRHKNIATTARYLHALVAPMDTGASLVEEQFRRFNV
jgi:integrase/recombinase XerD